jgi:hypothetical protein
MSQSIVSPTADDLTRIADQIGDALKIARENFGDVAFTHSESDLAIIQRILDNRILEEKQTYELQCLGLVFGDVLARNAGLHWVTVEDAYGRDPALQYKDTSLILFPLTMISKRVEDGQRVEVAELMRHMEQEVAQLKGVVGKQPRPGERPWWKFWSRS